jgi:hypothetical protein
VRKLGTDPPASNDTKVASFSDTHTALRFVIPVSARQR